MSCSRWGSSALCALVAVLACHSDSEGEKAKASEQAEKPAEAKPVVDQKIANAMAAAAQASIQAPESGAKAGAQNAPPQDGILGEEGAARELPAGSPAQLVLGSEGGQPRVRLGTDRSPSSGAPSGTLQLSYRSGGSVMPTVDIELKAKTGAGSEAAPGSGASASGNAPASASDALLTRFGVLSARPAADQPGRLPENARAEIAKLKGSWVDFVTDVHGAVQSQRFQVNGNNPVLQPLVQGSAVALASVSLPYPEVPVGAGAYWMVKSRETAEGADVIAYRMVKVLELTPGAAPGAGSAHLSVNTKRYLITPHLSLEGLPPHRVRQFQSEGSANLQLPFGAAYPTSAEIKDQFMSLVAPEERPQQAIPVQAELSAKVTLAVAGNVPGP
jgi:hypothetical protein